MNLERDDLWQIYGLVNDWGRAADSKAAILIAGLGVIATVALAKVVPNRCLVLQNGLLLATTALGVASGIVSLFFALKCLNPTLNVGEPNSLIFFAHIAQRFRAANDYREEIQICLSSEDVLYGQIADQVWANSRVAWSKYMAVAWAIRFFAATLVFAILAIVLVLVG